MTKKRDFKRRVRERQARTGESYVTARRRVVASAPARTALAVTEVHDVTAEAARLGFSCQVRMFPDLVACAAPAAVLASLREVLVGTLGGFATAYVFGVAFGIATPPPPAVVPDLDRLRLFLRRARAGLGGASEDGTMLAWHVRTARGGVPVLCSIAGARGLVLGMVHARPDDRVPDAATLFGDEAEVIATQFADAVTIRTTGASPRLAALAVRGGAARLRAEGALVAVLRAAGPAELYVRHGGRSYPVGRGGFVIGRDRQRVDLAIRDGQISRRHAAIVWRAGHYYIEDLGSTHGITWRGQRIDRKRIDDGDEIGVGDHVLAFALRDPG